MSALAGRDNTFRDFIRPGVERIDGGFMIVSFLYYYYGSRQANGVVHGEKSTCIAGGEVIKMVLVFLNILLFGYR